MDVALHNKKSLQPNVYFTLHNRKSLQPNIYFTCDFLPKGSMASGCAKIKKEILKKNQIILPNPPKLGLRLQEGHNHLYPLATSTIDGWEWRG
jgi:hypothetical protein